MPNDDLPILTPADVVGLLTTEEMCAALAEAEGRPRPFTREALRERRKLSPDHPLYLRPAGKLQGLGSRGHVYYHPPGQS